MPRRLTAFMAICAVLAIGCARKEAADEPILFGQKRFHDSPFSDGDGAVFASGTLTGEGVAWPSNTYGIFCTEREMQCLVVEVFQVGRNQIGDLQVPAIYDVTTWNADVIVAFAMDALGCRRETISLLRKAGSVTFVQELADAEAQGCGTADSATYRWTIEDSPGWKAILAPR